MLVMGTFGCLAYRNIRQTIAFNQHRIDRQLTRMVCMQVVLIAISQIPYCIYTTYGLAIAGTVKDADRLDKELFVSRVPVLLSYIEFAVCSFLNE